MPQNKLTIISAKSKRRVGEGSIGDLGDWRPGPGFSTKNRLEKLRVALYTDFIMGRSCGTSPSL